MQIKPNSNIALHIAKRVFKGFLSRAYKMCTEKYLQSEIDFWIDIFPESGHDRNKPTNIATEYLEKTNKPKIDDQNNTKNTKNHGCQFMALNLKKMLKERHWNCIHIGSQSEVHLVSK